MTICRRYARDHKEAEDILQEAFIRVFTALAQFRSEGSLEGWIRRIVVNTALRTLQKNKIPFSGAGPELENIPAVDADALSRLSAEELLGLISTLPDGYRVVFNLNVLEGYDHQEIDDMLNISVATSRSQLFKARKLLQTQIENYKKIARKLC